MFSWWWNTPIWYFAKLLFLSILCFCYHNHISWKILFNLLEGILVALIVAVVKCFSDANLIWLRLKQVCAWLSLLLSLCIKFWIIFRDTFVSSKNCSPLNRPQQSFKCLYVMIHEKVLTIIANLSIYITL